MECNKEEAIRAKALAEKKLQNKDFQGARKIALKAQQLYSDLENISQMLMVCDVHCSAEKKLLGTEMDWYGILQVERTADEATIKKQYRKFALQLHPDKNKFPGAEAAFKLVGEAQRVLLDREKRRIHDMKCGRTSSAYQAPPRAYSNPSNGVQNNFRGNYASFNFQYPKQPIPPTVPTFWTVCPFCSVKYQYYRDMVDRSLSCQNCKKTFVAYDVNVPGPSPSINVDIPRSSKQEPIPKHGYSKVELGPKGASAAEIRRPQVPQKTSHQNAAAPTYKVNNRKRGRRRDGESSESIDSESSSDSEEEEVIMAEDSHLRANPGSGQPVRRSSRQRQKVSYNDNLSDSDDEDEVVDLSGRAMGNGEKKDSSQEEDPKPTRVDGNGKKVEKQEQSNDSDESLPGDDSDVKTEENPETYEYPDPDFNDFEEERQEGCFSVGQVWAVYDSREGMPRFYVKIKKVFSPDFKLRVTWLEPNPDNKDEKQWAALELPVSCGKFKFGKTEEIDGQQMFSHRTYFEQGSHNAHIIYPNKGETWAIFKNWDIKWYSCPKNHQKYEYEFVEILSEYNENVGIRVAYLHKVKGFTSLFAQTSEESSFQMGPAELYRFSHRVPSFRMTGKEREGVPKGSFELDPASIPLNMEEIDLSKNHNVVKQEVAAKGVSSQVDEEIAQVSGTHNPTDLSDSESIQILDSEFHNFDDGKTPENFQTGQVWALYSDEDSLPKYYCQVVKVNPGPNFKLHIQWLSPCMLPNDVHAWKNKDMPISCGKFRVKKGNPDIYDSTGAFSHCMKAAECGKSGLLKIIPEKGDIWALYRHWRLEMSCSDLKRCEYDLVEVVDRNDSMIKVSPLERVDGFNSVFKCRLRGSSKVMVEIPMANILKFSHQVPAFRLSEERNGSLRGCWELDTAALPVYFFGSK